MTQNLPPDPDNMNYSPAQWVEAPLSTFMKVAA
jgi:hypothetical protein